MLYVLSYFWGSKYSSLYVGKLREGVSRHLKQPHRFFIVTDDVSRPGLEGSILNTWDIPIEDRHLLKIPGCLARLRMFDPEWQAAHGIEPGDRIVNLDLDLVVTGPLDPLFDREEPFVILQGANAVNPCRFNGSVWMLRAGYRPDVWSDFSLRAVSKIPFYSIPDDQAWIEDRIPDAAGWEAGVESGVLAFKKPGWPQGDLLPEGARLVAFPGRRDPSQFRYLPWIVQHW